jgi:hypothetical protein
VIFQRRFPPFVKRAAHRWSSGVGSHSQVNEIPDDFVGQGVRSADCTLGGRPIRNLETEVLGANTNLNTEGRSLLKKRKDGNYQNLTIDRTNQTGDLKCKDLRD